MLEAAPKKLGTSVTDGNEIAAADDREQIHNNGSPTASENTEDAHKPSRNPPRTRREHNVVRAGGRHGKPRQHIDDRGRAKAGQSRRSPAKKNSRPGDRPVADNRLVSIHRGKAEAPKQQRVFAQSDGGQLGLSSTRTGRGTEKACPRCPSRRERKKGGPGPSEFTVRPTAPEEPERRTHGG